jgi:hypothetical protein
MTRPGLGFSVRGQTRWGTLRRFWRAARADASARRPYLGGDDLKGLTSAASIRRANPRDSAPGRRGRGCAGCTRLQVEAFLAAQAVIEETALPGDAGPPGGQAFPIRDRAADFSLRGKVHQRVQVVRHQEAEVYMPPSPRVPEGHGLEKQRGRGRVAELNGATVAAAEGEKPVLTVAKPRRAVVGQGSADGETRVHTPAERKIRAESFKQSAGTMIKVHLQGCVKRLAEAGPGSW